MKLFSFVLVTATIISGIAHAGLNVVPAVQSWMPQPGIFSAKGVKIMVDKKFAKELDGPAANFKEELKSLGCGNFPVSHGVAKKREIFLTLDAKGELAGGAEGYRIEISDHVEITASSPAGIFYGTRTLLQLFAQDKTNLALPCGAIVDYPQYKHRMLMLDVGRKPFPLPVLKDYLRILSWYKMNELHLHLSDEAFGGLYSGFRVQSDTFPGLASKDLFYTKKELRGLQDMARGLGITITPEIDMPGHARCFTSYWPDLCLKGHPTYLDVLNPQTIGRLEKLLDEMIPIFDAPDFHIGTDEYNLDGMSDADQEKYGEAFRQFINTMNAYVRSKGKNCRIWSGYEYMPGKTLPDPSVTIDMWVTHDAKTLIEQGHNVINSSDGQTYIVPGAHYYGVNNRGIYNNWEPWKISSDASKNPSSDDPHLLGGKLHVWNDQGPTGYDMTEIASLALPSLQVFAEKLWGTKGSKDYADFQKRAALTLPVPGVTVFDRIPVKKAKSVILDLPDEHTLDNTNSVMPLSFSNLPRCDLEWPWTLTMQVCKTAETGTRGVILSSASAEVCSDYTRVEERKSKDADGKEIKTKVTQHGIGVVRAAGSPGIDPASSRLVNDVSRVFSEALPLNQWVTITVIGNRGHTTVYLDGVKTGESDNQTLCPLAGLGSGTGNSFVGKIRKLKVYDRALSPEEISRLTGLDLPGNLAAGALSITASSEQPGNEAANAMDGDEDTRWCAENATMGQWLKIDLGQLRAVAKADISWEFAAADYRAVVEGSDDEQNWKPLPGSFRFIRITVSAMPDGKWASIREIKLTDPNGRQIANLVAAKMSRAAVKKQFSQPDRICYDGHCLTIDGKDTFIYSATFHYFRTPRELWRDRFQKIKDAGFNTVETYVPWNWHERDLPASLDDFSKVDLSEIEAWLKMAQDEFGFYTIVRPGPFICAEWAGGGYPRWLAKFAPATGKDFWLRSADDSHIAWSVHWYSAVCKLFAREQLTAKPKGGKGIILVQIENEYDADGANNKPKLLRALFNAAKNAGVEVPIFTCLTSQCRESSDPILSQVFDCDNYYVGLTEAPSCAQRMMSLRHRQPDAPGFVTELQGGWFSTVGGGLSEDNYSDARHFNAISLMSLLGGATGLDPYVFVGGTHFGGWGARGQTTTYDYNAAIREWGALAPKYAVAQGISQFVRENEKQLLRAEGGPCELQGAPKNLFGGVRVGPDGTSFVFLCNTDPKNSIAGKVTVVPGKITKPTKPVYNIDQNGHRVLIHTGASAAPAANIPPFDVDYELTALGAKVLVIPPGKSPAEGVWYPKPQKPVARPITLPAPVRLASALKRNDPLDGNWQPLPTGKSLPELGVSDQRYVLYRAQFSLAANETTNFTKLLINSFSRDIVSARVNGRLAKRLYPDDKYAAAATRNTDKSFARIRPDEFDNRFDAAGLLRAGKNEIVLLYENIGHEHGYFPMEELSGVRQAGLGETETNLAKALDWQVATNLGGVTAGWTQPDFSARGWEEIALDTTNVIPRKGNHIQPKAAPDGLFTWYRLEFELPTQPDISSIPWRLLLNASGNGFMWLNGHDIGRHWELGPQREFYLPECWLKFGPGQNNIVILGLRETINGAKLNAAEISPYPNSAEIKARLASDKN